MISEQPTRAAGQRSAVPWMIAAGALVVYLVSLNRWITPASTALVLETTGWSAALPVSQPLQFLLARALRWLPPGWVPMALNGLSAAFAALTLALLAHSVMLMPQDRTRDQRMRERSHGALLSIPFAWVPPVLAAFVCGLELIFWRNAISATGEMLDLLVFASLIYCLLRFRISRNDRWLFVFTALYGVAAANNYALIALFPAFFVAFVWIKGFAILNTRFLLTSIGLGLAGLSLYLLLPLVHAISDRSDATLWLALKSNLLEQRAALYFYLIRRLFLIALSLASVVPIFLFGIRWSSSLGDTNALSVLLRDVMFHAIHLLFFVVCIWMAFDPYFSPYEWTRRESGVPQPFLTLYYLGALAVGYCASYLMLVFGREPVSAAARSTSQTPKVIRMSLVSLVWLALVLVPIGLVFRNLEAVRAENSLAFRELASLLAQSLPTEGGVALSDEPLRLLLARSELERTGRAGQWLLLDARLLGDAAYNRQIHRNYPDIWPEMPNPYPPQGIAPQPWLVETIATVAEKRPVYYLHPSFGYYFEAMYPEPSGMVFRLSRYPMDSLTAPPLIKDRVEGLKKYLSQIEPVIRPLFSQITNDEPNATAAGFLYSRTVNWWGTQLQLSGQFEDAGKAFSLATNLNPENIVAQVNARFNSQLKSGSTNLGDLPKTVEDKFGKYRSWEQIMTDNGPFDEPRFCFEAGKVFFQGNLIRQAGQQFLRAIQLRPDHLGARLLLAQLYIYSGHPTNALQQIQEIRSKENIFDLTRAHRLDLTRMEINAYFILHDTNATERLIAETYSRRAQDPEILKMLIQTRMSQNRLDAAFQLNEELLRSRPNDPDLLLNTSYLLIELKRPKEAIAILDQLLAKDRNDEKARRNRAIAHLNAGNYKEAQRDFESLLSDYPNQFSLHYGLGEVGYLGKDRELALRHYRLALKQIPAEAAEATQIQARIKELEGGK